MKCSNNMYMSSWIIGQDLLTSHFKAICLFFPSLIHIVAIATSVMVMVVVVVMVVGLLLLLLIV